MGSTPDVIKAVANEIERYLKKHPYAGDSNVGISEWWLKRQQIEDNVTTVDEALNYLLERGRIVRKQVDGREIYHSSGERPVGSGKQPE